MKTMTLRNWLASIVVLLCNASALAYDFSFYGVHYTIISETEKTAAVSGFNAKVLGTGVSIKSSLREDYDYNGDRIYTVTRIDDRAFAGCTRLKSITIPYSITEIGSGVFYGCSNLSSITIDEKNERYNSGENNLAIIETKTNTLVAGCNKTVIPDGIKCIGKEAFSGMSELTSINIPNSVTSIKDGAFMNCTKLAEIKIPNNVISIGREAFHRCTKLTSIEIPQNVTNIGKSAFMQCTKLSSIKVDKENMAYDSREDCNAIIESKTGTLIAGCATTVVPDGVTKIGEYAFYWQQSLTSLELPNSVTHIGTDAFHYTGLSSITLSKNLKVIGVNAFNSCEFTSIELPNSIDSIGGFAFQSCDELTSVVLPKNIGKIPEAMFDSCNGLKTIVIPEGVETIESRAFWSCGRLETIEFPSTLQTIGRFSFWGCESVKEITCHAKVPPTVEREAFELIDRLNCKLIVPEGSEEAYMAANEWKWFYTADGIEGLEGESIVDVYNLQGVMVKKQVRMNDLQGTLPKGIYIVNGKKIAVR